jgi:hypothetical protein
MQLRTREVAKFLSGIAFHETLGHWWLGIWGQHMLPWKFSSFTFTSTVNTVAMAIWPIVFIAPVWFAWLRKPGASAA